MAKPDNGPAIGILAVDHLDLRTLWIATTKGRKYRTIGNMTQSGSPATSVARVMLERLGYVFQRIDSPYEKRPVSGSYVAFSERLLHLAISRLEPAYAKRLWRWRIVNDMERARAVRFLTLASFKPLKRALEFRIALDRLAENGAHVIGFVERSDAAEVVASDAGRAGPELALYHPWYRIRMPPRPNFMEHENDLWPAEAAVRQTICFTALLAITALSMIRSFATWRCGAEMKLDILVLAAKPVVMPFIDDLYWRAQLQTLRKTRIGIVFTTPPEEACQQYYAGDTSLICELGRIRRGLAGNGSFWFRIRRDHLKGMLGAAGRSFAALSRGDLSPSMFGWMLTLYAASAFYEALMKHTGARLGWSMNEGHELNTQALALAAARTGGLTVGTSWSLKEIPSLSSSNNRNDVTFVWGTRQRRAFERSSSMTCRYVTIGYPATRYARETARKTLKTEKSICFYDNAIGTDVMVESGIVRDAYRCLFAALTQRPNCGLIVKAKREEFRNLGGSIVQELDALIDADRAEVRTEHGDLGAGLASEVVVGVGASTLALLAAQQGRHCIILDPEGALRTLPAEHLPTARIVETVAEFGPALTAVLGEGTSMGPAPGDIDSFADDDGDYRTAYYLAALLDAFASGSDADAALERADRAYAKRFGSAHIVHPTTSAENAEPIASTPTPVYQ